MALQEPLRFHHIPFQKVWGGDALLPFVGDSAPVEGPIGEVWELVDRDGASSEVAEGPFEGRSLRGLMLSEEEDLLGKTRPAKGDYFPLLVKFLDAGQNLSIQVHPDPTAADSLGAGAESKTECWYILSAEPGARLHLGFKADVDATTFASKASSSKVVDLLESYTVREGDFVFVPPGTVHSIGAGITLVEVQENSDTTYRLYDWGRTGLDGKPRETHVDQALRAIDYEADVAGPIRPELTGVGGVNERAGLVDCPVFAVALLHVNGPFDGNTENRAWIYVVTEGKGELSLPGREERWPVRKGETWLLPAAIGEYRLDSVDGQLKLLEVETKAAPEEGR